MAEKHISKNLKKYCWDDEEVDRPTFLYEECPCLWDLAEWNYAKGDVQKKQFLTLVMNYALTHRQKRQNGTLPEHNLGVNWQKKTNLKVNNTTMKYKTACDHSWKKNRFVEQIQKQPKYVNIEVMKSK